MKLVLDLQGAQSQSRHRGIGRYTLALTRAFLERATCSGHHVQLLLNARFDESTDMLIATLGDHARPERRIVLEVPEGIRAQPGGNLWLRRASARAMRHAIEETGANIAWYSSMLEGYNDDAVLPDVLPAGAANVATLYDLIPLHDQAAYLGHPRTHQWYKQSLRLLQRCDMLFAISDWVRQDAIQRLDLAPDRVINIGAAVDASFAPPDPDPASSAALRSRYGITRPFVLYNGGFDSRKNVPALIHAFAALPEVLRAAHQLVIVGRAHQEEMAQLVAAARKARLSMDSVIYTGFVPDKDLISLYAECALFAFPSLLEGFGLPPLEAMACGAAVIASHAASLPEVVGKRDSLFDPHRVDEITARMASVLSNPNYAEELRQYGRKRAAMFSWSAVANRALDALQELQRRHGFHKSTSVKDTTLTREENLIADIQHIEGKPADEDLANIACMIASARNPNVRRRWLIDVSSIAERDIHTGVQRVVRNILAAWLKHPPAGVHIEPIRFIHGRFRHARHYALHLLGRTADTFLVEDAAEAANGDVFFGLDWAVDTVAAAEPQLREWHRRGVNLQFLIHDLLPVTLPDMFHPYARDRFESWLRRIASIADRLICVSRSTKIELQKWLSSTQVPYQFGQPPQLAHSSPGADESLSNTPSEIRAGLANAVRERPTFLMVGTIEPRKGYDQALEALELLWSASVDVNLVIVGHFGWLMESFVAKVAKHQERERRLFWIDDADDKELHAIYQSSTALLAASWGEGYGLPLVEAARRGLPVIARDLPVFQEVMQQQATYFHAPSAADLADALRKWLTFPQRPNPATAHWISWIESATNLADIIAERHPF